MTEAETEDEDAPEPDADESSLSEGDLVLVDFEAWTEDGRLFDTTRRETADEAGWDVGEDALEPMPVLLGEQSVVPGFEEAILEAEIGEETEVDVPPTKAFGMHDDNRIETFNRREFEKKEIEPQPGTPVEINGRQGTVLQATASRVRVDFNHPFAGKTLQYKFTVEKRVTEDDEVVQTLIGLAYHREDAAGFEVDVDDGTATVTVPDDASFEPEWFMARHRLSHEVFDHTDLDELTFVDTVTREQMDEHQHGHGHGHGGAAASAPQSAATGAFEG